MVCLHKIVPGSADRSYGIHVARLAGLPKSVINRAQDVLANLESKSTTGKGRAQRRATVPQLTLFPKDSLLADEISRLDIDSMSPLEAITKLYELQKKAKEG